MFEVAEINDKNYLSMKNIFIQIIVLTTALLFLNSNLKSQNKCFKVDSIVVNYIPWSLKTKLPLSSNDVRIFKSINDIIIHNKVVIIETDVIVDFLDIDLVVPEVKNRKSIDARMVIDVFLEGGLNYFISLNSVGYYEYSDSFYERNEILNSWLNKYVGTSPISFEEAK